MNTTSNAINQLIKLSETNIADTKSEIDCVENEIKMLQSIMIDETIDASVRLFVHHFYNGKVQMLAALVGLLANHVTINRFLMKLGEQYA